MEAQNYLDERGFKDRQVRAWGDTNSEYWRYHESVVGDRPELNALDFHLFEDLDLATDQNIINTSSLDVDDPRRFLGGTPKQLDFDSGHREYVKETHEIVFVNNGSFRSDRRPGAIATLALMTKDPTLTAEQARIKAGVTRWKIGARKLTSLDARNAQRGMRVSTEAMQLLGAAVLGSSTLRTFGGVLLLEELPSAMNGP